MNSVYLLRGAVISLASFFVIYVAFSVLLASAWRSGLQRAQLSSNALFTLRTAPAWLAILFTALLVIPSYISLEPMSDTTEPIGTVAFSFAFACVFWIAVSLYRMIAASWAASRFGRLTTAQHFAASGFHGLHVESEHPGLFVVGIFRPALVVSTAATALLSTEELRAAMRHEQAHIASRDNLKKLLLRGASFPMLTSLDHAWEVQAEMDADSAAASSEEHALELASALVKVASSGNHVMPAIANALASNDHSVLAARVERLTDWTAQSDSRSMLPFAIALTLTVSTMIALNFSPAIARIHTLTELLIR